MPSTPFGRYSYADTPLDEGWHRDPGPEDIWAQQEIEITQEVETRNDLPAPDPDVETSSGQRRVYFVRAVSTAYRDDGSSWIPIWGLGTDGNPIPGTAYREALAVVNNMTVGGNTVYHEGNFDPSSKLDTDGGTLTGALTWTPGNRPVLQKSGSGGEEGNALFEFRESSTDDRWGYFGWRTSGGKYGDVPRLHFTNQDDGTEFDIADGGAHVDDNETWHEGNFDPSSKLDTSGGTVNGDIILSDGHVLDVTPNNEGSGIDVGVGVDIDTVNFVSYDYGGRETAWFYGPYENEIDGWEEYAALFGVYDAGQDRVPFGVYHDRVESFLSFTAHNGAEVVGDLTVGGGVSSQSVDTEEVGVGASAPITNIEGDNLSIDADGNLNAAGGGADVVGSPNGNLQTTMLADGDSTEISVPVADGEALTVKRWGGYLISDGTAPAGLTVELLDGADTIQASENTVDTRNESGVASYTNSSGSMQIFKLRVHNGTGTDYTTDGVGAMFGYEVA